MAAAAKTTTTPRASRSRAKTAAPVTPVAPVETEEETDTNDQKIGPFALTALDPSKNYAKFDLATDVDGNATGCVGTVYAPLGTTGVKIVYYGPNGE